MQLVSAGLQYLIDGAPAGVSKRRVGIKHLHPHFLRASAECRRNACPTLRSARHPATSRSTAWEFPQYENCLKNRRSATPLSGDPPLNGRSSTSLVVMELPTEAFSLLTIDASAVTCTDVAASPTSNFISILMWSPAPTRTPLRITSLKPVSFAEMS